MNKFIGVYYNKVFDTIMISFNKSNNIVKSKIIKSKTTEDIIMIVENDNITGINILSASKYIPLIKEKNSILSDDVFIYEKINILLKKHTFLDLSQYNQDRQFNLVKIKSIELLHSKKKDLLKCSIDLNNEKIVCGDTSLEVGDYVIMASVGAWLLNGQQLQPTILYGEKSNGMFVSAKEIGLENKYKNIKGVIRFKNEIKNFW